MVHLIDGPNINTFRIAGKTWARSGEKRWSICLQVPLRERHAIH
jgi:hypothetical protein